MRGVGLRLLQLGAKEGVVETLATGGETVEWAHVHFGPFWVPFFEVGFRPDPLGVFFLEGVSPVSDATFCV
jgi:hypothetical protein